MSSAFLSNILRLDMDNRLCAADIEALAAWAGVAGVPTAA
jgi:hypothetical protein